MRFDKHILSITLLVASLVYILWFVFAGFGNHQDPLYWLFKYEHLEGGWMAAGTILTGGTIVRILGAALLPLRIAGWLCVVGAIALPYCCLLNKEQRRDNLHWLGLTYVLMGYGAFQEFSPGTLTVLLLSAIWVCATKFKISNIKYKIFTALLAGLAVSVRFPNILVLLVLIPLWRKRSLWAVPLVAVSAGIIYLLGYWLLTPAPLDAAMSSHDLLPMISKLWENGGRLVGYALLGIGVVAIGKKAFENCHWSLAIWKGIAVGLALVYFIYSTIKPYQWYHMDLMYLISALVLVIAITSNPLTSNPLISNPLTLSLSETNDIARALGERKQAHQQLIGFALETQDEKKNALHKLERKHLDAIILNSLRDAGAGFGTDTNRVTILTADGRSVELPLQSKAAISEEILRVLFS